jgi:hypothetical protein
MTLSTRILRYTGLVQALFGVALLLQAFSMPDVFQITPVFLTIGLLIVVGLGLFFGLRDTRRFGVFCLLVAGAIGGVFQVLIGVDMFKVGVVGATLVLAYLVCGFGWVLLAGCLNRVLRVTG